MASLTSKFKFFHLFPPINSFSTILSSSSSPVLDTPSSSNSTPTSSSSSTSNITSSTIAIPSSSSSLPPPSPISTPQSDGSPPTLSTPTPTSTPNPVPQPRDSVPRPKKLTKHRPPRPNSPKPNDSQPPSFPLASPSPPPSPSSSQPHPQSLSTFQSDSISNSDFNSQSNPDPDSDFPSNNQALASIITQVSPTGAQATRPVRASRSSKAAAASKKKASASNAKKSSAAGAGDKDKSKKASTTGEKDKEKVEDGEKEKKTIDGGKDDGIATSTNTTDATKVGVEGPESSTPAAGPSEGQTSKKDGGKDKEGAKRTPSQKQRQDKPTSGERERSDKLKKPKISTNVASTTGPSSAKEPKPPKSEDSIPGGGVPGNNRHAAGERHGFGRIFAIMIPCVSGSTASHFSEDEVNERGKTAAATNSAASPPGVKEGGGATTANGPAQDPKAAKRRKKKEDDKKKADAKKAKKEEAAAAKQAKKASGGKGGKAAGAVVGTEASGKDKEGDTVAAADGKKDENNEGSKSAAEEGSGIKSPPTPSGTPVPTSSSSPTASAVANLAGTGTTNSQHGGVGAVLPKEETGGVMSGDVMPIGRGIPVDQQGDVTAPLGDSTMGDITSATDKQPEEKDISEDVGASGGGSGSSAASSDDEAEDGSKDEEMADGEDGEDGEGEVEDDDLDMDDEEDLVLKGGMGIPIVDGEPRPLLAELTPSDNGRKCLVLDLDETLVHSSFKQMIHQADFVVPVEIENQVHNVYVIKRPGVDRFLAEMGQIYEIVVFTASLSKYADPVLDMLDIHRVVKHRLFRESCYNHRGSYVKDLSQLGRPIGDTIIIDNSPASYIFHPNNAVPVSSWFNDPHDTELTDLQAFLADLTQVDDVRGVLDGSLN